MAQKEPLSEVSTDNRPVITTFNQLREMGLDAVIKITNKNGAIFIFTAGSPPLKITYAEIS